MSTLDKNAGLSCAAMSKPRKGRVVSTADTARSIQHAKKPRTRAQFLQIAADPVHPKGKQHKLTRVAFSVSRLTEFCTLRELQTQTGHQVEEWPLVVAKELMDNALDAAEEAEVAPVIEVTVGPGTISIQDNAGGFDAAVIDSILDYTIRVSAREAYVSPTRGAQGNALKTILAMGYVLDMERQDEKADAEAVGVTIIETRGRKHRIEFRVDHINSQPKITHTVSDSKIDAGTKVTIKWPEVEWEDVPLLEGNRGTFMRLVESYTWFNPHLTLRGSWHGKQFVNVVATNPTWEKWRPRNPTSPHWYDASRLRRYLGAHVSRDRELKRQRTVRDFIAEFRGLSGTAIQRQILEEVGCSHQSLAQFFGVDKVNRRGIAKLLAAMRKYSNPVKPKYLGIIGQAHFKQRFIEAGGNAETFKYEQRSSTSSDGIPYIFEVAFGLHQSGLTQGANVIHRRVVTGANWSVAISNPFRTFGQTGEGLEATLAQVRANAGEPVICALHLASAHIQFADRGKSSIILTDDAEQPK
jgi:DNA topoisomerase VI subunit B